MKPSSLTEPRYAIMREYSSKAFQAPKKSPSFFSKEHFSKDRFSKGHLLTKTQLSQFMADLLKEMRRIEAEPKNFAEKQKRTHIEKVDPDSAVTRYRTYCVTKGSLLKEENSLDTKQACKLFALCVLYNSLQEVYISMLEHGAADEVEADKETSDEVLFDLSAYLNKGSHSYSLDGIKFSVTLDYDIPKHRSVCAAFFHERFRRFIPEPKICKFLESHGYQPKPAL